MFAAREASLRPAGAGSLENLPHVGRQIQGRPRNGPTWGGFLRPTAAWARQDDAARLGRSARASGIRATVDVSRRSYSESGATRPSCTARTAAWVRSETPSLL